MADVKQGIIFRISSGFGPGGLASLKAGITMLGAMAGKVVEIIKDAEEFSQVWKTANKSAVLAADTAAKGLIDTGLIIKKNNELMESNVKITDKQFEVIAVRATKFAQKAGKDANEVFERMTKAVIEGGGGLNEYGLKLDSTGDLIRDQSNAIKLLTSGYEDATVEIQTTTEGLYALGNNLGTTAGLLFDMVGSIESVNKTLEFFNTTFGDFNTLMAKAPDAVKEQILSFEMWEYAGRKLIDMFMDAQVAFLGLVSNDLAVTAMESQIANLEKMQKLSSDFRGKIDKEWYERKNEKPDVPKVKRQLGKATTKSAAKFNLTGEQADLGRFTSTEDVLGLFDDYQSLYAGQHDMMQQVSEQFASFAKSRADIEASFFENRGDLIEEEMAMKEQAELQSIERIKENGETYMEYLDEQQQLEIEKTLDFQQLQREIMLQKQAEEVGLNYSHTQAMLGIDQTYAIQSKRQWEMSSQGKMEVMQGFFGAIGGLMSTESEKLFNIGKVGAIAEAGVNTALGAIKAYQSMAGIPYVGPVLGAIAAAAVTATGVAAIAKIKAQKFKGGGSVGGSVSTGSISGSAAAPSMSTPTFNQAQVDTKPQVYNLVIKDDAVGRLFDVVREGNEMAEVNGTSRFKRIGE